ncbi:MAG: hypothetical protein ABSE58_00200 [Candidatus Limnocylindrales bacterium]
MTGSGIYSGVAADRRPDPYAALYRSVFPRDPAWLFVLGPALAVALGLFLGLAAVPFAVVVLVPAPLVLTLLVVRGRRLWPAQEALMWPSLIYTDQWRSEFGGSPPRTPRRAQEWLEKHPAGSVPPATRAGMLLTARRLDDAREAISNLPSDSAHDSHRRLDLELALDAKEGRPLDTTAANDALRADDGTPQVERELHLAYHAALLAVDRGGDGIAPLTAARAAAGRMPSGYRRRILAWRYRYVGGALAVGAWLIAALLVGMATSGGVVWF